MNKISKLAVCFVLPLCVSGFAPAAHAATANVTFKVSATVVDSCSVMSTSLVFGSDDGTAEVKLDAAATVYPQRAFGTVVLDCAKGSLKAPTTTANDTVKIGRGSSGSFALREIASGANKLNDNPYRDASRISVWEDATDGTTNVNGSLRIQAPIGSASASHGVYGRIFGAQNAVAGAYSEAILVTIVY